jgi:hypothetical protein
MSANPWIIVVIADPSKRSAKDSADAVEGPEAMLQRALSLTAPEKVSCLIADAFRQEWASVYNVLRPANRHSLLPGEPVLDGLRRCLSRIQSADPAANVTVIPYNHCAVEETSWLDSTKGALRLGSRNRNTVYLLHDNPENDPRVALKKPDVCTSSVMVGTSSALLALCLGKRATKVVDLIADAPKDAPGPSAKESAPSDTPLNVVHIRSIEEYTRLQRTDLGQRPSQRLDIEA